MTVDESPRIAAARALNLERERRRMRFLRPMALIVFVSVLLPALGERPRPSLHGAGLPVTVTLVVTLVAVLAVAVPDPPVPEPGAAVYSRSRVVALLCLLGCSANVLNALQGDTVGLLSSNLVVWLAAAMLDLALAVPVALFAAVPAVVEVAVISSTPLLACAIAALFFGLIFLIGHNGRRMRKELARNELLVAELADMSEAVAGSAALAERGRIAREMHDVLAHSLSGLALQLEGAGLMAEREGASERLQGALRRARRLAHEGLDEARRAIEALRGGRVPGPDALPRLIEEFGQDADVSVTLSIDGEARPLSLTAEDSGRAIGRLWLALQKPRPGEAWIYYIEVDEAERNKGYGRLLLAGAEAEAAARGMGRLGLNVFGANTTARRLYESAGYETMSLQMSKGLSP